MPVADLTRRIRYYVSNNNVLNGAVSIVDGFTNSIVNTISTGLGATELVLAKDDRVYVANSSAQTISAICINGTVKTYNISNNGYLDVDSIRARMYVSTGTSITVNDTLNGALTDAITGFTNIKYVKLNASGNLLFVADAGDNSVKVFSTITLNQIAKIPTGTSPSFILLSEEDKKAYVSNSGSGTVSVINLSDYSLLGTISLGAGVTPEGLVLFGNTLYVANSAGSVIPVNIITNTAGTPIVLGGTPNRITLSPDKTKLYVTNGALGIVTIIDPLFNTVVGTIGGFAINGSPSSPVDIVGAYEGSPISPGDPIDLTDSYQLDDISESVCIITKKVFAHCQQRACFPDVCVTFPSAGGPFIIEKITFGNGYIIPGSEIRTPIPERPNFQRVQFTLKIPYTIDYVDATGSPGRITSTLENIEKDVVLFIPESRDEFEFEIVVETRSELLCNPTFKCGSLHFSVGTFIVIKVVGEVQLLIPAFGYCPAPPECEEYVDPCEENICDRFVDFIQTPFPEDFFPYQYEDINCSK